MITCLPKTEFQPDLIDCVQSRSAQTDGNIPLSQQNWQTLRETLRELANIAQKSNFCVE